MTHKQRILELLQDHRPHTHHELYALGCVAHSRISDLRRDGFVIECWRDGDVSVYQLAALNPDGFPPAGAGPILPEPSGLSASPTDGGETQDGDALIHPAQLDITDLGCALTFSETRERSVA